MKCCVEGCGRAGEVRANYPGSSVYCVEHGVCGRYGESVVFFTLNQELNIWMCPCRSRDLRPAYEPSGLKDYWQNTNASVSR